MQRKKLIEVALPLEVINEASVAEQKNPFLKGHPRSAHPWWARRPQAACRAVIFASLIDDPSTRPEDFPSEEEQTIERRRLFGIIERLVSWDNANNKSILEEATAEMVRSNPNGFPQAYDPFAGRGSITLEAQRLGLETFASDLNPIAVLICKALTEIPPKHANRRPVNPEARKQGLREGAYPGPLALMEDLRYYAEWVRAEGQKRIGQLYPSMVLADGTNAPSVAWIWARSVACPNPACKAQMPLISTFVLSNKKGKEAWLEPEINHSSKTISFVVRSGLGKVPQAPKVGRGSKFRCLVCGEIADDSYIKAEGQAGRMGVRLLAMVAQGKRGKFYLPSDSHHERIATSTLPKWVPDQELAYDPRNIWCPQYGLTHFKDLFTQRQLVAMSTFCDLIGEAENQARLDGAEKDYASALATYLGFCLSKMADFSCALCTWNATNENISHLFTKQAIPMAWDFVEANCIEGSLTFATFAKAIGEVIQRLPADGKPAVAAQADAATHLPCPADVLICTDPPYYSNISYANLSDFFYVWLRKCLFSFYPELFSTLLVPKVEELIATPYRFGNDNQKAQEFFESGFGRAMHLVREKQSPEYPMTIFYAFRETDSGSEKDDGDTTVASTGWETMLEGLISADFQITGTWPMRSERSTRSIAQGTNALASSVVLVCRPRPETAALTTRKDFISTLKQELGPAVRHLQQGNIAPVDLQQAAIGPGMAIFSRHRRVLESDGSSMKIRTALGLINQALDEVLSEQESDCDAETRWALAWFEQHQFDEGPFDEANTLANAKALSVDGLRNIGLVQSRGGKVRLLRRDELPTEWVPNADKHLTVWKVTQQLIRLLATSGQDAARILVGELGGMAETARELAYRLYTLCERKSWAEEAGYYNALVIAWPAIRSQEFTLTGDK